MRTGKTVDEILNKPPETQEFIFASVLFELEREQDQAKRIKNVMKGGR